MQKGSIKWSLFCVGLVYFCMLFNACQESFLEQPPTGALGPEQLNTVDGLEGMLIGTYSMLLGRSGFYTDASNWLWGSILGGDANKGSESGDEAHLNLIQAYAVLPNSTAVLAKYSALYEGISRANATLQLLEQVPINELNKSDLNRIEAEAKFLRGHYYFELKKIFNNTPYVDESWDGLSTVSNDQNLWPFIEADFLFAYENLPVTQKAIGRANKWAAASYLAKTYVFQKKYTEAKILFDRIITEGVNTSGVKYDLLPYYAHIFRATYDNSAESIFAVQAAVSTGSGLNANFGMVLNFPFNQEAPGRCCGFFQPSLDLANSFRTTEEGLPLLDGSYNEQSNAVLTDLGLNSEESFTPDTGFLDPRIDHSIGRRGIPYLDWGLHPGQSWIRNQTFGGPYSPKKFSYYQAGIGSESEAGAWGGFTSINYNIIRYADVLLMAAETEIELNNLEKGRAYINQVRMRAMQSPLPEANANYHMDLYQDFSSKEEAIDALRFERKLELSGEGHRFFDLVRWGIAADVLNSYVIHEDQYLRSPFATAAFNAGKDEYMPIPQTEIDLLGSDVLRQNPGY